jgi:hypothetical protein
LNFENYIGKIFMKNILTIFISMLLLGMIFFGCSKKTIIEPLGPINVDGFVKDYRGNPVSGAFVLIPGKASVTTNASGTFSIANVTTPYDITVIVSAYKRAITYKGLSRPNPKLLYTDNLPTTQYYATISGTVPIVAGKTTKITYIGNLGSNYTTTTTGTYSFTFYWYGGADSVVGKFFVLRYETNANGLPVDYDAYWTKNLTLKNGVTYSGQNFTAVDAVNPGETNISGSTVHPSDYTVSSRYLYARFADALIYFCYDPSYATDNFVFTVPSIQGLTFAIWTYGYQTSNSNISTYMMQHDITAGSTGVTVTLNGAPHPTIPINNSTNVDTLTQFTWTQGEGSGVYLVRIYPTSSSNPAYDIFTTSTSGTIPNLSAQALGLPSNTAYSWRVLRYYPLSTIDDVASDTYRTMSWYYNKTFGYSYSEIFNFTTKP